MNIDQLRSVLRKLSDVDLPTDERDVLDKALEPHSSLSVDEFCRRLSLAKASKQNAKATSPAQIVENYVNELKNVEKDADAFSLVVGKIKYDKSVRASEAKAIATAFTGAKAFKTKADALKAIALRQLSNARGQHRRGHIQDIF
jgi:hypothetical protein